MTESALNDRDALRRDLHGTPVGLVHTTPILRCDYCDTVVETTDSIVYEALRVANLPMLETFLDPPVEWILDAARCHTCAVQQLQPATAGYDEALVRFAVTERDGILNVDGSTLRVVDLALAGEGYAPPQLGTQTLAESGDVGVARWLRLRAHIEQVSAASNDSPAAVKRLTELVNRSSEVPPRLTV